MALLIFGLLLFTLVHLVPAAFHSLRASLIGRMGDNPYRGIFSLVVVISLVLIVLGWKSAAPTAVYAPPLQGGPLTSLLVFVAFVLFVAARSGSNVKRIVRHPQMVSVILWSAAHLLANGDSRSIALFGGLGIWSVAEILLCNRRDGAWRKPDRVSAKVDVITVVIGGVAFALLGYFHQTLFGVAPGQ
jgi:uncharacterized membrane protein